MIIELYGLSGSGKTTFAHEMEKFPGWMRVSLSGKSEIISYYLVGLLLHPVIYLKGFYHCATRNRTLYYLWNFYVVQYAKYQKAYFLSSDSTFIILDEGPLQTIITYPEKILTEADLDQYLLLLPKVDKVVIFNTDEKQRKKQLRERVHHQSWRKKTEDDESYDTDMIQNDLLFKAAIINNPKYYLYNTKVKSEKVKTDLIK